MEWSVLQLSLGTAFDNWFVLYFLENILAIDAYRMQIRAMFDKAIRIRLAGVDKLAFSV